MRPLVGPGNTAAKVEIKPLETKAEPKVAVTTVKPPQEGFGPPAAAPLTPPDVAAAPSKDTAVDRTRALLTHLNATAALGTGSDEVRQELATALGQLSDDDVAPYGRMRQVLAGLEQLWWNQLANDTSELKTEVEQAFMQMMPDYLAETGKMLEDVLSTAQTKPGMSSMMALEERTRYASSAARGAGKAENEGFARLADEELAAKYPELAPALTAAERKLSLRVAEVNQTRLDMIGMPNGGFSVEERAKLLHPEDSTPTAAELGRLLDLSEKALSDGAGRIGAALYYRVSAALNDLTRVTGVPPEYAPIQERLAPLKPRAEVARTEGNLLEQQLLLERKLDDPKEIAAAVGHLVADDSLRPAQKEKAIGIMIAAQLAEIGSWQDRLDAVANPLQGATVLTPAHNDALNGWASLPRKLEPATELGRAPAELKAQVDAKRSAYETGRTGLGARLETLFEATLTVVQRELDGVAALPPEQQRDALKALYKRAEPLEILNLRMPKRLSGPGEKLTNELYARAFPERAVH